MIFIRTALRESEKEAMVVVVVVGGEGGEKREGGGDRATFLCSFTTAVTAAHETGVCLHSGAQGARQVLSSYGSDWSHLTTR